MANLLGIAKLSCVRDRRELFRDLSFTLSRGECREVRGPNGSGKSTLLRCIAGLFPDYAGRIQAASAAYVGHRAGVSALLTPLENLAWYVRMNRETSVRPAMDALERLGIGHLAHVPCQSLSQGQLRRAALARLCALARPLWLLDEPFTALDQAGTVLVADLIREHCAAGGAVLAATHAPLGVAGAGVVELG